MKGKIAITTTSFGEYDKTPFERLKKEGFETVLNTLGRKLEKTEISEICNGCVGIVAGTESYDQDVLKNISRLKVISRCGAGMDNVDLKAAKELNIRVLNTPDGPTLAVAELTVGLIFSLLRKIALMDRNIRSGNWQKLMGNLLSGKKIGIIGLGRIGRKVAEMLAPLAAEMAYYDVERIKNAPCKYININGLLAWADIVTLHCPAAVDGNPVIGGEELKRTKKGAWLINIARGGLVDEAALYEKLKEGHLAGAALDVFEEEPYAGPLLKLDNVVLTPHIGSYAKEARVKMEVEAVNNLIKGLEED